MIMATLSPTQEQEVTSSQAFWNSLDQIPDGKRVHMCIQCGTCSGICPFGRWLNFTPRKVIAALRAEEFDEVLQSEAVWMCVSCYACADICPQDVPTTAMMVRLKEELMMTGNVPPELHLALQNSRRYGNPMGESPKKRAEWAEKLDPPLKILGKDKRSADVLWYVGDFASYHPQGREGAKALVKVFRALNIDFGILGPDEVSDGDSQRMAGETGLFEWLAIRNGAQFGKYKFNQIVTTDPHAYNAIKNAYPTLDIKYPVRHYTEFLHERLPQLKKLLKYEVQATVAYHDPCYLGRVNGIYDEPRELLKAIPGVQLIELSHTRDNSLCCGGGGGGMWLDGFQWEKSKARLSEWRMREVVASKPIEDYMSVIGTLITGRHKAAEDLNTTPILAVACPYEKPRFTDAAKTVSNAQDVRVMDIAELLARSIG